MTSTTTSPPSSKPGSGSAGRLRTPTSIVKSLIGDCMCHVFPLGEQRGMSQSTQLVELHSVRFIGLGAVMDELTPRERVYDTLEQLTTRTDRLISVGYLLTDTTLGDSLKVTETVPLDTWDRNFPNDGSMNRDVKRVIDRIRKNQLTELTRELQSLLASQLSHLAKHDNRFMAGITAHNLGVVHVLSNRDEESEALFRQAISLKEAAFGEHHPQEVALSWSELGIQLFARGDFEAAMSAFRKARHLEIRASASGNNNSVSNTTPSPNNIAMVLNNMACCEFQMGHHEAADATLIEARRMQHDAGSPSQADRDLLHVAIVIGNCGYLKLALKQYDEARSLFEEALLIQQSVLDESHRAIRDTRSNIEFTNAFHSVD